MKSTEKKVCTKCKVEKDFTEFTSKKKGKFGLASWCRLCTTKDCAIRYANNKQKYLKKNKERYEKNKGRISEQGKKYRERQIKKNKERNIFDESLKTCPICKKEKKRISKNWSKSLGNKDGLYTFCKKCRSDYRRNSISVCINVLKEHAPSRNLDVPEKKSTYIDIMTKPCYYCGEFDKEDKKYGRFNGIDRLDSDLGYIKENCVSCCWWCNTIKWNKTVEEMYKHLEKILNNRKATDI